MSVRFGGKLDTYETLLFLEERLGLGLFVWNLENDEVQWSDGMYAVFGLRTGSVKPTIDLMTSMTHPDDRISTGWLKHAVKDGKALDRDVRISLRDGRTRHIIRRARFVMDGSSQLLIGACLDVTNLQEAKATAEQSQERLKALIAGLDGEVWVADHAGRILDTLGPGGHGSTGLPAPSQSWIDRLTPVDRETTLSLWQSAVRSKTPFSHYHGASRNVGDQVWCRSTAAPVLDEHGGVIEWIGVTFKLDPAAPDARQTITGAQIRGGRGILNWSVRDLADAAHLTVAVIRRLEEIDGVSKAQPGAAEAVQSAMEVAGVEFLNPPAGKPAVRPK